MSSQYSNKIKGPPKPWNEEMNGAAEEFVDFLKDAESKKAIMDYLLEAYKEFEQTKFNEYRAQYENEKQTDNNRIEPHHRPGNIGPAVSRTLSMNRTEKAFARAIKSSKDSLDRRLEERVEEVNRLLAGIGGFSSQLKSCFARSTVVFYEQDDPEHDYRERLIFSIHLPKFELKRCWDADVNEVGDDGRTPLQATWDDAVNALAKIIESSGLKAKYCKNDRNYGQFTMKQDLRNSSALPDEFFSLILDYITEEKIKETSRAYNKVIKDYDAQIAKLEKRLARYSGDDDSPKYLELKKELSDINQEKNFFVGTVPDPSQVEEGLLLYIDVSTLKDYQIVKDRMQTIMTKFILHLSKIATKEAEFDPDLEYEMWKSGGPQKSSSGEETVKDVQNGQIYKVDAQALRPVESPRKKVA